MKVTFFSNFMNHHQLPFCLAMRGKLGEDFVFVAMEPVPKDKLELGYSNMNSSYDFVLRAYESANYVKYQELIESSDIALVGSAPEEIIVERAKNGLLTIRYSERLFKTALKHALSPSFFREMRDIHKKLKKSPVYLFCAGAYVAFDFKLYGYYWGKTYKWGYFPEFISYDINSMMDKKEQGKLRLLWAGRLIDWKHPECAIDVAKRLRDEGVDYELNIIGTGPEESNISNLVKNYKLDSKVHILGAKKQEEVREYMLQSNIFLFTSDRNEGWGAVLNEAMNSGCAVVCNHMIGAVPFMVRNEENGLIYRSANGLYLQVKKLVNNPDLIRKIGISAYDTIENEWNAQIAAERFMNLAEGLIEGNYVAPDKGICSKC